MGYERVLGVYAHPDDADVGSGASLAHFAAQGAQVSIVVATLGDAGGFSREGHDHIRHIRRQEQLNAAAALGIANVIFLDGYRDGMLEPGLDLVRDIVEQIRIYRPQLLITLNPEHNWESVAASHPDHRAVGEAAVRAVYPAARNPFSFPELLEAGLEPWYVDEVWLQGHQHPNFVHQVDEEDMERKIAAVSAHVSQFEQLDRIHGFVRKRAHAAGEAGGSGPGSLGEEFLRYYAR